MSPRPSRLANYVLATLLVVLGLGALFRARVQAWEATLPPDDMFWIKLLVAVAAAVSLTTVLVLALSRRRGAGRPEKPPV